MVCGRQNAEVAEGACPGVHALYHPHPLSWGNKMGCCLHDRVTLSKPVLADGERGSPAGFEEVHPCFGEDHVTGNGGGTLGAENGPVPTATKKAGLSVLHAHGTQLSQR